MRIVCILNKYLLDGGERGFAGRAERVDKHLEPGRRVGGTEVEAVVAGRRRHDPLRGREGQDAVQERHGGSRSWKGFNRKSTPRGKIGAIISEIYMSASYFTDTLLSARQRVLGNRTHSPNLDTRCPVRRKRTNDDLVRVRNLITQEQHHALDTIVSAVDVVALKQRREQPAAKPAARN